MSYRYMRIVLFFDLPSITYADQKEYNKFHNKKWLYYDARKCLYKVGIK